MPSAALAETVVSFNRPEEAVRASLSRIHDAVLGGSQDLQEPNFTAIHTRDLEVLFAAYDSAFFSGLCRQALEHTPLTFRLSRRMSSTGGTTARFRARNGDVRYEITVAVSMLFDAFRGEEERRITVAGIECGTRLQALQRIFEHEIVHLIEHLCWDASNCSAPRFQDIARRVFLHRAHTHTLITRGERAARAGIRTGARVCFTFEGVRLTGRVNRVTKRATVLVPDPAGLKFSDGGRYRSYYVPLSMLELAKPE